MTNTVFYLLGFPGVGKYTIAKEIAALTGAKLVDNHYILNPIFGLIQQDGITPLPPRVWDFAWQVQHAVYGTIRELSPKEWSFIFTNGLKQGDPESDQIYADVLSVVTARQSHFVPVRLLCEVDELAARIANPDRRERMKEVNPAGARERHARSELYQPDHPNVLSLDVTRLSPKQAAEAIVNHASATLGL